MPEVISLYSAYSFINNKNSTAWYDLKLNTVFLSNMANIQFVFCYKAAIDYLYFTSLAGFSFLVNLILFSNDWLKILIRILKSKKKKLFTLVNKHYTKLGIESGSNTK